MSNKFRDIHTSAVTLYVHMAHAQPLLRGAFGAQPLPSLQAKRVSCNMDGTRDKNKSDAMQTCSGYAKS